MTAADEELGSRVAARAGRAGVSVDAACAARLAAYLVLLQRWNARMNLTALDTADSGLDRLVIEPLAAARHLPRRGALIDIGSGGGSPAIPIKIANPGLAVRMVESKSRKGAFLREAVRCLGLDGTVVEDCRYQALMTRPELRETHDVLTLRAVRLDAGVLRNLQAFVRSGGALALFRGEGPDDGLRDLPAPLVRQAVHPLVNSLGSRLIIVRKPDQPTGTGDTPH